jgi:hypothetical protein
MEGSFVWSGYRNSSEDPVLVADDEFENSEFSTSPSSALFLFELKCLWCLEVGFYWPCRWGLGYVMWVTALRNTDRAKVMSTKECVGVGWQLQGTRLCRIQCRLMPSPRRFLLVSDNASKYKCNCRSGWPRGLRRRSAAAWLLGSRLRTPLSVWMCCLVGF